jgi:hypothetical protein
VTVQETIDQRLVNQGEKQDLQTVSKSLKRHCNKQQQQGEQYQAQASNSYQQTPVQQTILPPHGQESQIWYDQNTMSQLGDPQSLQGQISSQILVLDTEQMKTIETHGQSRTETQTSSGEESFLKSWDC